MSINKSSNIFIAILMINLVSIAIACKCVPPNLYHQSQIYPDIVSGLVGTSSIDEDTV